MRARNSGEASKAAFSRSSVFVTAMARACFMASKASGPKNCQNNEFLQLGNRQFTLSSSNFFVPLE